MSFKEINHFVVVQTQNNTLVLKHVLMFKPSLSFTQITKKKTKCSNKL